MKADYFQWGAGEVAYWDLDNFDPDGSIEDQIRELKEDLAQVYYADEIVLDVGWHPEFDANGAFLVMVVQGQQWDAPLYRRRCKSLEALRSVISEAVRVASVNDG